MPKTKSISKNTAPTSTELTRQIEALRQQADALKAKEKPQVVANIKTAIAYYGLTASDLGLTGTSAKKDSAKSAAPSGKGRKPAVKKRTSQQYRDAAGNTWSGFGPRPKWLKDALAAGASEESLRV